MGRVGREGQGDHRAGVHECGVEKLHLKGERSGEGVGGGERLASFNIPSGWRWTQSSDALPRNSGGDVSFDALGEDCVHVLSRPYDTCSQKLSSMMLLFACPS